MRFFKLFDYGCLVVALFFSINTSAQFNSNTYEIYLKSRTINEFEYNNTKFENFTSEELVEGRYYRILQFSSIPNRNTKSLLKLNGINLLEYIPNKSYLGSIDKNLDLSNLKEFGVRSALKIRKEWKQDDHVKIRDFEDWAQTASHYKLVVHYFNDIDFKYIKQEFENLGIRILKNPDYLNLVTVEVPKNVLSQLLDSPFVLFVCSIVGPGVPDDDLGRSLHRNSTIDSEYPMGRKYDGSGVNILVRDDGQVGPHIDFKGRLSQEFASTLSGTHADGVAGMAVGAGNLDPTMKGAAKGAFIFVKDYIADFLDETMSLFNEENVLITNSSYSNGCNGGYTSIAQTVDAQINQNPTLLHVFSAGNSNNMECGYGAGDQWGNITGGHKQGKNVLTTANLFSNVELVESSSRGPAHDGRIKPDISAHGQNQIGPFPNNNYTQFGGTSAAAPCVMGTSAQLYQAYKEIYGQEPESALIKATLLNTANDIQNEGPDFKTGWGHLNAYRAILTLENEQFWNAEIEHGQIESHSITIPENTKQVRIMVYWNDVPASILANKALVNDLNMEVISGEGSLHMPWVLNAIPHPDSLDLPAIRGIDNLNNMEQVLIHNPTSGEYQINVNGFQIPFEPVKYYIVYDIVGNDDITVVYPFGGESLVPDENVRIHWDAFSNEDIFTLEYSLNDGQEWNLIGQTSGFQRSYNWKVPNEFSGKGLVRVSRNGIFDTNDFHFSIFGIPTGLHVSQICPEYFRLNWNSMNGADSYVPYLLGERFMESKGISQDTFMDIYVSNPLSKHWVAISALGEDDKIGRRSIAVELDLKEFNCLRNNDLGIVRIEAPKHETYYNCENQEMEISILIQNNSADPIGDFEVSYQIDNNAIVSENVSNVLAPFEQMVYTFTTTQTGLMTGIDYLLKTSISSELDTSDYNDSYEREFEIWNEQIAGEEGLSESFESLNWPPEDWVLSVDSMNASWNRIEEITQKNGFEGSSAVLFNSIEINSGEEDRLSSPLIDLSHFDNPLLSFDFAHRLRGDFWEDSLRLDIYTECGNLFHSTLFGAKGETLSTTDVFLNPFDVSFRPTSPEDWRTEFINLADFKDQIIRLVFVSITDLGESIYLDNINLVDASSPPEAQFSASDKSCVFVPVEFINNSSGFATNYFWNFGDGAIPANSNEQGPINVFFIEEGLKTIELTLSNDFGSSTFSKEILISGTPTPSFDYAFNGLEVSFENTSINCESYRWDFGDNNIAFEENPNHQYDNSSLYTVVLQGSSENCDTFQFQKTLDLTTNVEEELSNVGIDIFPNPSDGNLFIKIDNHKKQEYHVELIDTKGENLMHKEILTNGDTFTLNLDTNLQSGIYFVRIFNKLVTSTHKIVIQ